MTEQDLIFCRESFTKWNKESNKTALLLSANKPQTLLMDNLIPNYHLSTVFDWDLNTYAQTYVYDVIVACNVFHYSNDPGGWFHHVFASCKEFWIQDLYVRNRGPKGLGIDGDKIRYSYNEQREGTFDLGIFNKRILDIRFYDAGSYSNKATSINFVARLEGDL